MRNGREELVDSDDIAVDDIVIAKPGEKIAADGVIIIGESSIDESMITGESVPIDKKIGDEVIGGTINMNGYLQFKATNVGNHTVLTNIIEMVKKARMSKAPLQRIADRAVQYFIPIVLAIAIASSLYWIFVVHQSNNGGHSSMSNFVRHISRTIPINSSLSCLVTLNPITVMITHTLLGGRVFEAKQESQGKNSENVRKRPP
jgi:P-type E1-E2 ATPase